ncbi:hypothetical protein ETB97_004868 [Aspergillus alliaceus]|uniref:Heterokaryon incompatibility domain-containing protein n=1 Tax=Petromyces alliaceus TaxID=209559 RepID=A0A8H5ZZI0_PETAA|nr:hypothetical protein ETB97_004868 [Aspergillus burnettii]
MPQVLFEGKIRLAELTPFYKNNPIHLNLRIIDLRHSRVPEYDALSYSSATDTFSNTIFLGTFWDVLHAPSYFQAALRCIQRSNSVRLVWGDYICIDHQTIRDKNQQVSLMREIYMSAELVPAGIGRPSADSDLVLQTLKEAAWGQIVDLVNASRYRCRDPRDKVFGILGLVYENVHPDYALSLEVYIGIAAYLVTQLHKMNVPALAGSGKTNHGMPS